MRLGLEPFCRFDWRARGALGFSYAWWVLGASSPRAAGVTRARRLGAPLFEAWFLPCREGTDERWQFDLVRCRERTERQKQSREDSQRDAKEVGAPSDVLE